MAAGDIMPWTNVMGGSPRVQYFRLNAAAAFREGEPVYVNADGEVTESATDTENSEIIGIAATSGDTTGAAASAGSRAITTYPCAQADGLPDTGDMVGVYISDPTTYWITRNFTSAGAAWGDVAPALANLGDECGLANLGGNTWGLDLSVAGAGNIVRIVDILDADKTSIQQSGGTGVWVVFAILATMMSQGDTAIAEAPAA